LMVARPAAANPFNTFRRCSRMIVSSGAERFYASLEMAQFCAGRYSTYIAWLWGQWRPPAAS
jgi:hypothetical protein